ncbi:MAG: GNAT family N-acetyltransferase [Prevotella sp.]|nr:GNAT family N-acetyltransferase [Prevotella sp.]
MFEIRQYTTNQAAAWNQFVEQSRQGTFLLNRSYMDYHADRFHDHSLMVYRKGRLHALLPANRAGDTLWSHQGLTYGGLITDSRATAAETCEVFRLINAHAHSAGIRHIIYKAIPWIYHQLPAEEDLYALTTLCHARLTVREISSTIPLPHRMRFAESRRSGMRKAIQAGVTVRESADLAAFWNILNDNLERKYNTHPVHTLAELELLRSRFPKAIRLFMAHDGKGKPLGGTVIYETPQVIHTQYISASPEGKATGALDLLFDHLINKVYADRKAFFDFGKSTEDNGQTLNTALIFQKEGFGGRGVCYDRYEWDV